MSYLLGPGRQARIGLFEEGYDPRFLKALWDHSAQFGFNPAPDTGPLKRAKTVFSPTLRDGSMVRTGPVTVNWIGLENSSFLLMASELVQLWWGPAPPPLWAVGNGLEVHSRDQLALALGSPKPSQLSRITEMEACEAAFLLEERCVRPHGRSLEAQRLREQLDQLPYFKKLRSPGTSLGDLQACVALSKLRPGGLLWWAREEPLTDNDGSEFLHFVLERAKIVCEWDFSELEHSLPTPLALFPKRLYLLAREPRVEERHNHRPSRVTLQGQIRSHVEIPLVFQDALGALHRPIQPHGHWKVHEHRSPSVQRDWAERWPDPSNQGQLRNLERLRQASLPLATFATVRPTPEGDPANDHRWSVHPSVRGLWIRGESNGEGGRKLYAEALPRPGRETKGHGLMLIVPDESWVAPLASYLRQPESSTWLDHHCERRGDRWVLAESTIKFLPIPKLLLSALGVPISGANRENDPSFAQPLPGEWERLATEIPHQPKLVQEALQKIPSDDPISGYLRSALFVRAARALENLSAGQGRLLSVVTAEGRIRWREMLEILPKSECTPLTLHPGLKITGQIPPHIPIGRWDRIRAANAPGILFSTEIGLSLQLSSEASLLIDMLWEQLDGLDHPTWSELVQYLRVPRRLEIAEATASDVLRSHGEQTQRLIELGALVAACAKLY